MRMPGPTAGSGQKQPLNCANKLEHRSSAQKAQCDIDILPGHNQYAPHLLSPCLSINTATELLDEF
jgi:hypothetical protein